MDLVITSPPYFMNREYDTSNDIEDFRSIHSELASQINRVVKPSGSICWQVGIFAKDGAITPLDYEVHTVFQKYFILRNRIVWTFGHGMHARNRFSGRHETILWYSKSGDYFFDLDPVRVPQKYPGKRFYKGPNKGKLSGNPLGKNPGDVWDIPNVNSRHVEKEEHPCQFPVSLALRLVKSLCPEGGLVLDPFAGTSTTGIACMMSKRKFLGSELNPDYASISESRFNRYVEGTLPIRPDKPPAAPNRNQKVATLPEEFQRKRAG